jgi:hypothetical protein
MDQFTLQAIKRSIQKSLQHTKEVLNNETESHAYAYGYLIGVLNVITEEINKAEQLDK